MGSGRVSSIGPRCVLIIRLRTPLAARCIRNRAVTGNIVRLILIATPARCAHLMPQEGADRDDECGAHQKRGRQHRQILEHRTHRSLTPSRSESCPSGQPNGLAALEPAGDPLARQGLPPPFGCPVSRAVDSGVRSRQIGSSLGRPAGSYPAGCFHPLVGKSHTSTADSVLSFHCDRTACRCQITRVLARRHPTQRHQGRCTRRCWRTNGRPRRRPGNRTAA